MMSSKFNASFKNYRNRVPWEWFRDLIIPLYSSSDIREVLENENIEFHTQRVKRSTLIALLKKNWSYSPKSKK